MSEIVKKNQEFLQYLHEMKFNHKFNTPDDRDYKYRMTEKPLLSSIFKINVNNTNNINVLSQGSIGSCVSNSFALSVNILSRNTISLSRLFHYYCGRSIDGDSSLEDSGLDIRQAAKIISQYGVVAESEWPYIESRFNVLPPLNAFQKSIPLKDYKYSFLDQNINTIKDCLSNKNRPIIFGIIVYSSFMSQAVTITGVVPMPNPSKEKSLGGHCITMIGFDDKTKTVTCVNSWGPKWGKNGTFTLPYDYVLNPALAMDFCSISFTI